MVDLEVSVFHLKSIESQEDETLTIPFWKDPTMEAVIQGMEKDEDRRANKLLSGK